MNDYTVYKKCPLSRASRFRFRWDDGNTSLNDNGIKIIKAHKHQFCYILQQLHVLVRGRWCPIEYHKTPGTDDTWEMIIWHM